MALPVPTFRDAVVSVPLGAIGTRPILVALHGNYDRPEWQCEVWRAITRGYPFILCPRGTPRRDAPVSLDRWTYAGLEATRRELEAGLLALGERFPGYVDAGPNIFASFSLGAILGVGILKRDPARYPRAILTEGGHSGWTRDGAEQYARASGARLLFACGQASCKGAAAGPQRLLKRKGVEARIVFGGEIGHAYDGPVADAIAREWPWLIGGDPRWSGATASTPDAAPESDERRLEAPR
jgi:hypothetical protein